MTLSSAPAALLSLLAQVSNAIDESDEQLMQRYQQGDEAAFRCLFTRYAGPIYRYFLHRTGRADLALDCAQATWLKLHRARQTYRRDERVRPWLYAIAANLRIDALRSQGRSREALTSDGVLPELAVEGPDADGRERAVRRALLHLPDEVRTIIILHRWHELGFAEIAAMLGQSEGAVKLRAHRAYLQLRTLLLAEGISS